MRRIWRSTSHKSCKAWLGGCFLGVFVFASGIPDHAAAAQFGTRCQEAFEDGWQDTQPWAWETCSRFNSELDDTDTKDFYYNLKFPHCGFDSCDDQGSAGGVDSVDLFYVHTHGGVSGDNAILAMWDDGDMSWSSNWRFGDDDDEVAIFSQYACETLSKTGGGLWTRLGPAFRGGLYVATGSYDKIYSSITTDEVGEDYADGLQKRKSVKNAWFDGNSDWWTDQDLRVMATGVSSRNCRNRRNRIKWHNVFDYTRRRDSSITHYCTSSIEG
ncbi:MAG: DUF6345 domain-containing protein [Deltaproteobacteria bacterium]